MIFFMNRERKMGERKIDVTATLGHAPSTGAEFVVSGQNQLHVFYRLNDEKY